MCMEKQLYEILFLFSLQLCVAFCCCRQEVRFVCFILCFWEMCYCSSVPTIRTRRPRWVNNADAIFTGSNRNVFESNTMRINERRKHRSRSEWYCWCCCYRQANFLLSLSPRPPPMHGCTKHTKERNSIMCYFRFIYLFIPKMKFHRNFLAHLFSFVYCRWKVFGWCLYSYIYVCVCGGRRVMAQIWIWIEMWRVSKYALPSSTYEFFAALNVYLCANVYKH